MDDSLNMESNQLLDKLYSDIDLLPLKVNDVVDLVKQNFEKKSKIHYDSAQFEIKTLNEKISKEQIELQDVDEINRLITNVDNLRKELEFKTSDFHRSIDELRSLTDRTKQLEEENDELRRRMGALARRNKRKGQVLNSETNSTTSRSHRLSYTKFPTNQRFSSRRKAHVGENTGDLHNQSDDDICDDKVDISNQNQSINVDNIESEESPEQDNIKIIHDSNIAYNIEVCDELISNGLSMEQALHRAISIVSSKVEKRLSNLPGNHSKLRGRDISGYNINAFTHINTYEAIVKFLSHPEQFSRVVQQLQLDVNDINTGIISKARDTFHRSNKK